MEPTDKKQDQGNDTSVGTKPDEPTAPTQIIINSEDGSIVNAAETESSASSEEVTPVTSEEQTVQPPAITDVVAPSETTAPEVTVEAPQQAVSEEPAVPSVEPTEAPQVDQVNEAPTQEVLTTTIPESQENPMAIPPQTPKKSGAPKLAVALAVIIAISLMGVVVFAYLTSNNKQTESTDQNQTLQTPTVPEVQEKSPTEEIDAASKEIEDEINKTTGDNDIPNADSVNDQTLGL